MEQRNINKAELTNAGFKEGVDFVVSGPHDNGYKKMFVEYHCTTCVWSSVYPDRMKQHLETAMHIHRLVDDSKKAAMVAELQQKAAAVAPLFAKED